MGCGIAEVCIASGLDVILSDVSGDSLERGIERVRASIERKVGKGEISPIDAEAALTHLRGSMSLDAFAVCDMVVEAATEDVQTKERIIGQLDKVVKAEAVIASNTSSVSITALAAKLSDPSRFIGMHFFNPVPVMSLVEIIRGIETTDATYEATISLATRVGKTPISVKNSPGFAVNRILIPMINEAIFVLQEGLASAQEIDAGMRLGANHPIGPLALADLVGLDTTLAIMEVLYRDFNDPKYRPAPLLREMVDARRLGRKTGKGFHSY
jgi:3-hydroxybutyryl-CoA dehydrogenase